MIRPRLDLFSFVEPIALDALIDASIREDMGPRRVDVTSELFVSVDRTATATFVARQPGQLCGAALLPLVARHYDADIRVHLLATDGQPLAQDAHIAQYQGPLRSILAAERVALNFLTHLSGIATATARYVHAVRQTRACICDTRKTIPGLRGVAKYAVACGGGVTHRLGLYDAVLVKDNHIAHLDTAALGQALGKPIAHVRREHPHLTFIEVEVDTLDQLDQLLRLPAEQMPDIVLLDNMAPDLLRQAVALRDQLAPEVELEASGGITLDTVAAVAQTGVDRISVGAITHSAPALDIGLDILEIH